MKDVVLIVDQKPRLTTVDVRALNHILKHAEDYQKPEPLRYHLSKILGEGRP